MMKLLTPTGCTGRRAGFDLRAENDGATVLKLKTAWRDGTTHLVMAPLDFMQWLAALVARPRLDPIRFHGVLAPNAGCA